MLFLMFRHSVVSDSETPWTAARPASLSLTISRSLHKFMFIASVMRSSHLIFWCLLLLLPSIFPSIRDFSKVSATHIRGPKYWSFSISPSSEYSGFISFKIDRFDLLAVQGTFRSLLQHHNSSVLSFLYGPTVTSVYDYWKNHMFGYMDLCQQSDVSAF